MTLDPKKKLGPMFNKLAIDKFSTDATCNGQGLAGAISVLSNPSDLSSKMRAAFDWADDQIKLVRTARDADPNWTDEHIAEMIMTQIEARRKLQREQKT